MQELAGISLFAQLVEREDNPTEGPGSNPFSGGLLISCILYTT